MRHFKPFIVPVLLLALGLTACHKDKAGIYQPKKKIQQIYYSEANSDKIPFQVWDWSGSQLSSITHFESLMKSTWTEHFTYDNGRLSRVDNYNNKEYITYDYADDQLKTANIFYRNTLVCTWTASYDNGKLNKLTGTIYEGYKASRAELTLDPLAGLLPKEVSQQVAQREQQQALRSTTDEPMTLVLLLTWDNDQIHKIIAISDELSMSFMMQYDDKNCPFNGFMGGLEDYYTNFSTGHTGFTKNNVTQIVVNEGQHNDTVCYAYQYDADKYPILQTMYEAAYPDDKMVLYYEY